MGEPPYDALLVVSFGGPEGPEHVMPFLERVTRGRGVPRARLEEVATHYHHFGGRSPINDRCRELVEALRVELPGRGLDLPVYWGNRFWDPLLPDVLRRMSEAGIRRALAFVTSGYGSYSGCRAYLESIAAARLEVGPDAPRVDKLRVFFDHPGFVAAVSDRVREALGRIGPDARSVVRPVFTAHSVPISMARAGPYVDQLRETCRLVAEETGLGEWDLVWQSRSGPPQVPWLEPDVLSHLRTLYDRGVAQVLLIPAGFVSDHMEVVYDLDHEAAALARSLGMHLERAGTAGAHPRFVQMIGELVEERTAGRARASLSPLGPAPDVCPADCCPAPVRPTRPGS